MSDIVERLCFLPLVHSLPVGVADVTSDAATEITRLRAQVAALEVDAGRYRWLRSQPLDDPEIWIAVDSASVPGRWALGGDDPDGCDAAIDAALAARKGG